MIIYSYIIYIAPQQKRLYLSNKNEFVCSLLVINLLLLQRGPNVPSEVLIAEDLATLEKYDNEVSF